MPALDLTLDAHSAPDDAAVAASFRDPGGFVFERDGLLLRQVNPCFAEHYDLLMHSGLYDELTAAGLLIEHEEADEPAWRFSEAHRVLRPRRVPLITYPYEWCFSQFQDAALATLDIQRRALARGLWLKDASAYNIQWLAGRPVLIDTLSLERYDEGRPWIAYGQFCRHFLAPLALMHHVDARLGQLSRVHLDGVPLDLASRLLPRWTKLTTGLGLHLHAHARSQRKHSHVSQSRLSSRENGLSPGIGNHQAARRFSRRALDLLLHGLEHTVRNLRPPRDKTPWSDYYTALHNYSDEALLAKERLVAGFVATVRPRNVWDLGANDGRFSRLAAAHGTEVAAWDLDFACVERNYVQARGNGQGNVLPLLLDLINPSPACGWAHHERMSLAQRGPVDLVLALGLIHHLAIGNNLPLARVAEFLARLGRSLVIEFVPKTDSQVRRLLASRADVFPAYQREAFEAAFRAWFRIVAAEPIPGTESATAAGRTIYLMETFR